MKPNRIFYGNINMCVVCRNDAKLTSGLTEIGNQEVEHIPYKDNAKLVMTKNGFYVDIDDLSLRDIMALYLESFIPISLDNLKLMNTYSRSENELWVEPTSLDSFANYMDERVSIRRLSRPKYINGGFHE